MSFDPPWREEMKDDSCFEPYYALTSTARCCFLFLFFFKKSAERWANHLIVVQHADDEQELTPSHSAVFDLQQIFSILPVYVLYSMMCLYWTDEIDSENRCKFPCLGSQSLTLSVSCVSVSEFEADREPSFRDLSEFIPILSRSGGF